MTKAISPQVTTPVAIASRYRDVSRPWKRPFRSYDRATVLAVVERSISTTGKERAARIAWLIKLPANGVLGAQSYAQTASCGPMIAGMSPPTITRAIALWLSALDALSPAAKR